MSKRVFYFLIGFLLVGGLGMMFLIMAVIGYLDGHLEQWFDSRTVAEPFAMVETPVSTAVPPPTLTPTPELIQPTILPTAVATEEARKSVQVMVTIDRSNLPDLYYTALTLKTEVGRVDEIRVTADGSELPFLYDPEVGIVQYTTDASEIFIDVLGGDDDFVLGLTEKTFLRDDKQWAWSHGFDDNVFLFEGIDLFVQKGWRGSVFLIGEIIDEERDEDWIVDQPAVNRLLADGWSIGSHGWLADCTDKERSYLEQSFDLLADIVALSPVPEYKVINFAAPCFFDEYHPLVLAIRDSGERTVLFNESQNQFYQIMNVAAAEIETEERLAVPLDLDLPIGRDFAVEFEPQEVVQANIDWAAALGADGVPLWYNSGSHGSQEENLAPMIDYVYDTYGPAGDDSVWVAPSDEIVSYALVRELAIVTVEVMDK